MTLAECINSYHARKTCPIFVLPSSRELFQSQIAGYTDEPVPAMERFIQENKFQLVRHDGGTRLKFIPEKEPEDYEDEWKEEVAFDRSILKA